MFASTPLSRPQLQVVPQRPRSVIPAADDLGTARKRMRHLAPWNVRPLPTMHSAGGKPADLLTLDERERAKQVALRVLAVQMYQAAAHSELD